MNDETKVEEITFDEVFNEYQNEKKMHCMEGRRGVNNLACIARSLGYFDRTYMGQFDTNASLGDLIEFFEDNPGAIDAVVEWISQNGNDEWKENLISELPKKDEDDGLDEDRDHV